MFYRLVFSNQTAKKNIIRNIALVLGILLDCVAIFALIQSIYVNIYYIALIFASLILSVAIRLFALNIHFKVEYKMQNNVLIISQIYPLRTKKILSASLSEFEVQEFCNQKAMFDLSIKEEKKYFLQLNKQTYICNLDNYMFACIKKGEEI